MRPRSIIAGAAVAAMGMMGGGVALVVTDDDTRRARAIEDAAQPIDPDDVPSTKTWDGEPGQTPRQARHMLGVTKAQEEAAAERQRRAMIKREIKASKLRKIAARGGIGAIEPPCSRCEGYGYVQVHSPSPPAFETCDLCGNPEGHPLP